MRPRAWSPADHRGAPGRPSRAPIDPSRVSGSSLLDLAQTQDLGAAVHVLAHLAAEGLEVLARAVRLHGRLIGVALHEDIRSRRLSLMVECVELAARLMSVDLGHPVVDHRVDLLRNSP